jgi:glutathione S-transferase
VPPPLGLFDATLKVRAWRAALAARPSVRDAVAPDDPERLPPSCAPAPRTSRA